VQIAAITYRDGQLEAREQDDQWTVRLADLETRARYLDLALAELLGNAPEAHRVAAKLLAQFAQVVELEEAAQPPPTAARLREQRCHPRRALWTKPVVLGLRALVLLAVVGTAFMLTTWLNALR
jgi:hypothetical protein